MGRESQFGLIDLLIGLIAKNIGVVAVLIVIIMVSFAWLTRNDHEKKEEFLKSLSEEQRNNVIKADKKAAQAELQKAIDELKPYLIGFAIFVAIFVFVNFVIK